MGGKHNPSSWRSHHPFYNNNVSDKTIFDKLKVLPIVMIKDPVNWMSSMCRNSYGAQWRKNKICPYLVADKNDIKSKLSGFDGVRVNIKHRNDPKHSSSNYLSLLHLWNTYYNDWLMTNMNANVGTVNDNYNMTGNDGNIKDDNNDDYFPRLIVRYEDLLYHTEEVIEKVCNCAVGKMFNKNNNQDDNKKKNQFISFSEASKVPWKIPSNDLLSAAIRYGSLDSRNDVLTNDNKEYAIRMIDRILIQKFHYLMP